MTEFLTLAMQLAQLGHDIAPLVDLVSAASANPGGPSDTDWAALHDLESKLRARLAAEPGA